MNSILEIEKPIAYNSHTDNHIIYTGRNEEIPSKFNFKNDNINSQPFSFPDCSLLFEVIISTPCKKFFKTEIT